ncbi:hypothetical protein VAE151_630573 [Vibrio aestuarianus]|uniref:Uncharacterized protein n=1 Tax=Vibrio aestuarianus TaxID=28171 RepID=A0ABN8TMW9_9VIBR|nr:hypothetical protein VAE063_1010047 [Vibrio aestuarianus]CAH8221997.1 hypothetical protein VAE308_1240010 [Vibrio aestuarianus]CAH8226780.1 hypothetical protein VAE128_500565 [Vibrio aestuarianus]CAH8226781.1 hypothetical protein VAE032_330047 [Vibrio aestuarianus]CAH8226786.1 hypothetical protein VAE055_420573 [Vibrio aestuarianus]
MALLVATGSVAFTAIGINKVLIDNAITESLNFTIKFHPHMHSMENIEMQKNC